MTRIRQLATRSFALLSLVLLLSFSPATIAQQKVEINEKRYDFAQLVDRLSERAGYFPSDNLVSNELSYQHVLGRLEKMDVTGGAYLGVGPDQNFTYIAQIKPRIAFMVDIRRDAMLQHLMFKALFVMSRNRVEYLSNLFARPLPKDHKKWGDRPIRDFIDYFDRTPLDQRLADRLTTEVRKRIASFGLQLSQRDIETIDEIYQAFYTDCLEVRYTIRDRPTGRFFPAYRDLLLEKDLEGRHRPLRAAGRQGRGRVSEGDQREGLGLLRLERRVLFVALRHHAQIRREPEGAPDRRQERDHPQLFQLRLLHRSPPANGRQLFQRAVDANDKQHARRLRFGSSLRFLLGSGHAPQPRFEAQLIFKQIASGIITNGTYRCSCRRSSGPMPENSAYFCRRFLSLSWQ